MVELNRVFSHGLMMGFLALDLGGLTPILYGFINRDQVVDMLSAISGQRMLFNFFRVGGVNFDVNDEFLSRLGTWRAGVLDTIEMNEKILTENEIFGARTKGLGRPDRQGGHQPGRDRPEPARQRRRRSTSARPIRTRPTPSSSSRSSRRRVAIRTRATCSAWPS